MTTVSVYEELLALFRRFAENGGEAHGNGTVIEAWRKTLSGEDQMVLRTLALLRGVLGRAIDQISSSPNLDADDKAIAIAAMRPLDELLNLDLFHRPFADVADRVASSKISMLVLLANALKPEFPEATLVKDDVARLSEAVDELSETVRNSNNIDVILRNRLLGHIGYIRWSIRNIDLTGVDAIYAAFGPPLLFLQHEIATSTAGSDDALEPKKLIYQRMDQLFRRIMERGADQT